MEKSEAKCPWKQLLNIEKQWTFGTPHAGKVEWNPEQNPQKIFLQSKSLVNSDFSQRCAPAEWNLREIFVFHTVFDVKFWWNFPSHTQTLKNVGRKISPKFHAKFHDTFGREKRRNFSLPHFCRVAALTSLLLKRANSNRFSLRHSLRYPSLSWKTASESQCAILVGAWVEGGGEANWVELGCGKPGPQPLCFGEGPNMVSDREWVFFPSPSSWERAQWGPLSLWFGCKSELTEFGAESSEFSLPKLCSWRSTPPVSYCLCWEMAPSVFVMICRSRLRRPAKVQGNGVILWETGTTGQPGHLVAILVNSRDLVAHASMTGQWTGKVYFILIGSHWIFFYMSIYLCIHIYIFIYIYAVGRGFGRILPFQKGDLVPGLCPDHPASALVLVFWVLGVSWCQTGVLR